MDTTVTIKYSTDDPEVNDSVSAILDNTLPFMVDNVEVHFETEED